MVYLQCDNKINKLKHSPNDQRKCMYWEPKWLFKYNNGKITQFSHNCLSWIYMYQNPGSLFSSIKYRAGSNSKAPASVSRMTRKSRRQNAVAKTSAEFGSRTTIHGIGYIFDRDLSVCDRAFWVCVVVTFLASAAYLSYNTWTQWRENQVG